MDIQYDVIEELCCVLDSGEALKREIEKDDLYLLVDALHKDLNFFVDNEEFANDVNDAVDEIEIRQQHPYSMCEKICKSKGGLTRHIRAKHELKLNESKTKFLHMKDVDNMFAKATAKIGETACICKDLKPSPLCVDHMDKLCRQFMKKSDQNCLVHRLYKLLADKQEKLVVILLRKHHTWSHLQIVTTINLLFIHIPELLVAACKGKLLKPVGEEKKS